MPQPFKASLITPEAIVLETTITAAQVPVFDGLVGILDHRAPLLAKLGTGVVRLDTADGKGAGVQRYMVSGGYVQMKGDELTILTTEAVPASQVTPEMISATEAKLNAVVGDDKKSMEQRQAIRARLAALKSARA